MTQDSVGRLSVLFAVVALAPGSLTTQAIEFRDSTFAVRMTPGLRYGPPEAASAPERVLYLYEPESASAPSPRRSSWPFTAEA